MSFAQLTVAEFLDQVAARTPAPGGGAVAALSAATAAALGEMVARHSKGLDDLATTLAGLRHRALELADRDAEAFSGLAALWKLSRDDPARQAGWEPAVTAAIDAPWSVIEVAREITQGLDAARTHANPNLASDLVIAAELAECAARAAACNVRVNLPLLSNRAEADAHEDRTRRALETVAASTKLVIAGGLDS